jgi:hypothetical protein
MILISQKQLSMPGKYAWPKNKQIYIFILPAAIYKHYVASISIVFRRYSYPTQSKKACRYRLRLIQLHCYVGSTSIWPDNMQIAPCTVGLITHLPPASSMLGGVISSHSVLVMLNALGINFLLKRNVMFVCYPVLSVKVACGTFMFSFHIDFGFRFFNLYHFSLHDTHIANSSFSLNLFNKIT